MDLQALMDDIRDFVAEREWERFHDPKNLAMCLASEAGELLAELRWIASEDADAHCRPESPHRQAIEDEVADVAVSLLMFVDRTGIDLARAVHAKMQKNRRKYPPGSP